MTINTQHNPIIDHAIEYVRGVADKAERSLRPGWETVIEDRISCALGYLGTFQSPAHGRLWLSAQAADLFDVVEDEDG